MKKFLLIAFTVLFAISLVACSAESSGISEEEAERRTQEKLDEAAETFGEFIKYRTILENDLWFYFGKEYKTYGQIEEKKDANLTKENYTGNALASFIEDFYETDDYTIDVDGSNGCTFKEGKCSGTSKNATISNVKMTASYDIISKTEKDENGHLKETGREENKEFTISEFSYVQTDNEDEDNPVSTISIKATIDGADYSIEYTQSGSGFTSASVNGKEVNTKILNAYISLLKEW